MVWTSPSAPPLNRRTRRSRDHHRDDPGARSLLGHPELALLHDVEAELVVAALQLSWIEYEAERDPVLCGLGQSLQRRPEFAQRGAVGGLSESGAQLQRLATRALGPRLPAGVPQGATQD